MSTSGETAWSLTALDIVMQAMRELGVLPTGETPENSELQDCLLRLNAMLKTWQGQANLFRNAEITVQTLPGVASITLPADVRDVSGVRHVASVTYDRPLTAWNRSQYYSLPHRAAAGNPSVFYLDRQRDAALLYLWPVPVTAQTLKIDYSRIADTVTEATQTLDIPEEWQEAVYLGLAARIAGMFGATRADPNTVMEIKQRADVLYQQLLDRDRPDSYYFEAAC